MFFVLGKKPTVKAYFSGGFSPYYTVLTHVNGGVIDTVYQSINDIDSVIIDSLIGSYSPYIYDSIPNSLNGDYFCPQLFQFNIHQPQSPMSSSISLLTHVSCWGDSTGARVLHQEVSHNFLIRIYGIMEKQLLLSIHCMM